jgi:hypothetical protein
MPKEKRVTKFFPRYYKWNAENLGLFFFIKGQTSILPAMTIEQAIFNYLRFTGITLDEWDLESIKATYVRLQKEYYENTEKDSGSCE